MKPVLTPLSPHRQMWGWAIAIVGLPLITVAFSQLRDTFGLTSVLLLYLVLAMVVALVGGALPAVVAVVGGFVLANWYFTPPYHQLAIAHGENLLALVVYVFAAGTVAVLVDRVGRSRMRAARSQAEAEALAALAGSLTRPGTVAEMVDQLRVTFGVRSAALLAREADVVAHTRQLRRRPTTRSRSRPTSAETSETTSSSPSPADRYRARTSASSTRSPPTSPRPPRAPGSRPRPPRPPTWRLRTRCAGRCCKPCRTTCARRWRPSRPRSPASGNATSTGRPTTSTSSNGPSRKRRIASPTWSTTCST